MLAYISKSICYVRCLEYVYAFNLVCVGDMFWLHPMLALTLYVFVACFGLHPLLSFVYACLPFYVVNK